MKNDKNNYPTYQSKELEDYRCIVCGKDLLGKVRIQNDVKGYVKCLYHGLGVGEPFLRHGYREEYDRP